MSQMLMDEHRRRHSSFDGIVPRRRQPSVVSTPRRQQEYRRCQASRPMTTRIYPPSWYLRCFRCWWTNTRPLTPPIGCPPRSGGPARTWPPIGCFPRSGSPARIWPRCRSRRPTGLRGLKFQTEQWGSRLVAVSSLKQRLVLQVYILLYVAPKWQLFRVAFSIACLDPLYSVRTFRTVSATGTLFTTDNTLPKANGGTCGSRLSKLLSLVGSSPCVSCSCCRNPSATPVRCTHAHHTTTPVPYQLLCHYSQH